MRPNDIKVAPHFRLWEFECPCCFAVRVYRLKGKVFFYGDTVGISVNCSRRAEDYLFHPMLLHGLTEDNCSSHIVAVVGKRIGNRFPYRFKSGKLEKSLSKNKSVFILVVDIFGVLGK